MKHKITFEPDGTTITVDKGTNLLEAALAAGVHVNATCGGQGVCGKCQVVIESGEVDGEKSEKIDHDDLVKKGPYDASTANGWLGTIQHHFVNAIVPPADALYKFHIAVNKNQDVATASVISGKRDVAPGSTETWTTTAFVGPKLQSQLEEIDPKLKLTVDYGWLTILSQPLFWLLSFVYGYVANWGVAIILLTLIVMAVTLPWQTKSMRSMRAMAKLKPQRLIRAR